MEGWIFKVDSRFRGNDKNDGVIPAKAGIQIQSGVKFFKFSKNALFDPVWTGERVGRGGFQESNPVCGFSVGACSRILDTSDILYSVLCYL